MFRRNEIMAFIILMLFAAGCTPKRNSKPTLTLFFTPTPISPTLSSTAKIIPSATALPTAATKPMATEMLAATSMLIPTVSATVIAISPLPSIMPTLKPTLTYTQSQSSLFELIKNNAGCKLPCWWGLTPGETSLQTTKSLLDLFGGLSIANSLDEKGGYFIMRVPDNNLFLYLSMDYPKRDSDLLHTLWIRMYLMRQIKDGYEVVYGDSTYKQFFQPYLISQILSTYGKPSNVWVFVDRRGNEFHVWLSYAVSGFLVDYVAPVESENGRVLGCLSKAYTELWLWPPERKYTPAEAVSVQLGNGLGQEWFASILPLRDATTMTVGAFYEIFKDPQNTSCLETPVKLWPEP